MTNLIEDLSLLSGVSVSTYKKISSTIEKCIVDYVIEAKLSGNDVVDIDVGFAKIFIKISDDELKYKIVPSRYMEKSIINAIQTNTNDIEITLEQGLIDKITKAYKENM